MIHIMEDDWKVFEVPTKINTSKLYPLIKDSNLTATELNLDEVAYKELSNIDIEGVRYLSANTDYPLIVVEGLANPYDKKYRMIDGRHRLLKQMNEGKTSFLFYILTFDEIKHFIERL